MQIFLALSRQEKSKGKQNYIYICVCVLLFGSVKRKGETVLPCDAGDLNAAREFPHANNLTTAVSHTVLKND